MLDERRISGKDAGVASEGDGGALRRSSDPSAAALGGSLRFDFIAHSNAVERAKDSRLVTAMNACRYRSAGEAGTHLFVIHGYAGGQEVVRHGSDNEWHADGCLVGAGG